MAKIRKPNKSTGAGACLTLPPRVVKKRRGTGKCLTAVLDAGYYTIETPLQARIASSPAHDSCKLSFLAGCVR
jgi:hypothetical protein